MKKRNGRLTLILTNQCNLNCVYCYEKCKGKEIMTFDIAQKAILEEMNSNKYTMLEIYLFGGEPFLEFELIKEIVEWMENFRWKIPYRIMISTNGVGWSKEIKLWLKEHRNNICIVLSLDGDRISHNLNRNNSYDKIDINFIRKNWPNDGVKMTISEISLPRLAQNVIHIHELGMKFSECNFAMGMIWNKSSINILNDQMSKLLEFYMNNPQYECANIINMPIEICEKKKEITKVCGAGENRTIYTDGTEYPCNYITPMGFNEKEIEELKSFDLLDSARNEDMKCFNECYLYPICPNCYAANYSVNHCINKRNKSVCGLIQSQAYYTALLQAEKIKLLPYHNLSDEERTLYHKKIGAIKKIIELYDEN